MLAAQLNGGTPRLTVDLSELRFADSAPTRPQTAVARILSLLGLDQVLNVRD
jgi:anti-anti-sigma regulatory factor